MRNISEHNGSVFMCVAIPAHTHRHFKHPSSGFFLLEKLRSGSSVIQCIFLNLSAISNGL